MKKLLLLLGFLAGAAHAQDEYYALSAVMTNVTYDPVGSTLTPTGPVTVSGWIETSGFGVGCVTFNGPPCLPVVNGHPTDNPLIINYEISLTYNGVTESVGNSVPGEAGGWGFYTGIVATPKGLFCNRCGAWNENFPYFTFFGGESGKGGTYEYGGAGYEWDTPCGPNGCPCPPSPCGLINLSTNPLKNNWRIGNQPTTTMPTMSPASRGAAAPELNASGAGAALTLLVGMGLVLQGRRRG